MALLTKEDSKVKRTDLAIRLLKDWQMTQKVVMEKGRVLSVEPELGESLIKEGTAEIVKQIKVK